MGFSGISLRSWSSYQVSQQERIRPTIWPTSFWEFFKVYDKKSQNDSEGVDLALK